MSVTSPEGASPPPATSRAPVSKPVLPLAEFVALMALLAGTVAFSIDAMLPALPEIGSTLSPGNPNAAQLVVVAFVFGMGVATLFAGPLSDALGRKTVMLGGAAIYCAGAIAGAFAASLEALIVARVVQGIGASGPRIVAQAMIRDLYAGRTMAKVTSIAMMIFTLVPAIAPLIGAWIIAGFGWRAVFWSFVLFSAISGLWLAIRQPETLPQTHRRPLRLGLLQDAAREVFAHGNVRRAILVQTLVFGTLFSTLVSVQPIYEVTFDRGDSFPYWFGLISFLAGAASFLNARLVERLGMLWLLRRALAAHLSLTIAVGLLWLTGGWIDGIRFPLFLLWQFGGFALAGLTIGNLLAIAMQPMGHIAGMAVSIISAVATVLAVLIASVIGLAFDGTPLPLLTGVSTCAGLALVLAARLREA